MSRQFQFVSVSKPTEYVSSASRKLNHSHVMRHVHARKRRSRTQKYQDELTHVGMAQDLPTSEMVLSGALIQRFASSKDPFSSLARPLSSEEYFLLNHYIHVVVPYSIGHCDIFDHNADHREQMLREWVGLAITDDTFMTAAVLLSTCRYMLLNQPGDPFFTSMALRYKQACLRSLRLEMESKPSHINVISVAKALALAVDEVNSGEHGIARKHVRGVLAMVQFSGGPKSLGLTGLLERMCHRFLKELRLTNARDVQLDAWWHR